ncbi:probable LRR receptor-like serine/threonine-protein kinase At2g23950 [Pistacia vera]|uniref:probable LRR receptor-like serine/threonine-protein kinase At2g23950 n=1 Tax=Pistacia vera TaxID=55513 RepID=UPI0012638C6C|nr:probable LRR receptor-like serine/threonine-protein kinase At2g23950 [Pistacia vera]
MKGKYFATLMPSKFPLITTLAYPPNYYEGTNQEVATNDQPGSHDKNPEQEQNSSAQQPAATPHWYPLSWRSGFPRAFSLREVEEITDGFGEEILLKKSENLNVYEGIFQETPVVIKSFQEDDDRFWTVLMILSRVRHRNIMNLVGYCCTGSSRLIISDFPCLGTLASNLNDDELARKLTWKARWYIAIEIGGSLRYLHEECGDGPIVHQSVCSGHIVFSHGCSAMLCNFLAAKWLNLQESPAETENSEQDEKLYIDVRDYGMFLLELITGQNAEENKGQSLLDWAVPLIKDGNLEQVKDPRLLDANSDKKMIQYMAKAALLCLKFYDSPHPQPTISKILAVVRGDPLAISKCSP